MNILGSSDAPLMEMAARFPWWASAAAAVIAFFAFRALAIATAVPVPAPSVAQIGDVVQRQWIHTLAFFLQFLVPLGLAGGLSLRVVRSLSQGSVWKRAQRGGSAAVARLHWTEFEISLREYFQREGYEVSFRKRLAG
jgi:hypothetical protein